MLETISTNSIRFLVDFCLWNLTCTTFEGMKIRQPDKQWDEDPGQKISNIRRADGRSIHTQQVWYAPILLARHFQTCDYDATSIFLLLLPICKRCIFIHMRTRPAYPYLYSTPPPPLAPSITYPMNSFGIGSDNDHFAPMQMDFSTSEFSLSLCVRLSMDDFPFNLWKASKSRWKSMSLSFIRRPCKMLTFYSCRISFVHYNLLPRTPHYIEMRRTKFINLTMNWRSFDAHLVHSFIW